MTWTNALDVEGAELVARDPSAPNADWFDPVALYPDYVSVTAGVVTVTQFGNQGPGPVPPYIMEFGIRFPVGFEATNTRVSLSTDTQATPPGDGSTVECFGALVLQGGADIAAQSMSAASTSAVSVEALTLEATAEVGAVAVGTVAPILSFRSFITPP